MTYPNIYYAKIILFGEYGVIFDSMALTIPFVHFHGELSFSNGYGYTDLDFAQSSNQQLKEYANNLVELREKGRLKIEFDVDSLIKDIEKGLYFESSIPQSYGLGSSGALVAAMYCKYGINTIPSSRTISPDDKVKLKNDLSELESYFHGKSSGIDPLNAYIKYPLLLKSKTEIEAVTIPRRKDKGNGAIFLVNTGGPGKTEPLVHLFMDKCKIEKYNKMIMDEFIPQNNNCITSLLAGHLEKFFDHLEKFSDLQLRFMNPMIPYHFQEHWKHGLETNDFSLKLCGSGGGGYLLGFTKDFDKARTYFKGKDIQLISVYRSLKQN
ncbi:MAG: mevalonate kinase [Chlorobi bacterium]|nr:mevalonate kinase [Chlorobiota bacterium]